MKLFFAFKLDSQLATILRYITMCWKHSPHIVNVTNLCMAAVAQPYLMHQLNLMNALIESRLLRMYWCM